jgi:hypothetical protein
MPTSIIVPDGCMHSSQASRFLADPLPSFAFVGAALMSLVYLAVWQSMQVGKARKAAGIAYPQSMHSCPAFFPFVR